MGGRTVRRWRWVVSARVPAGWMLACALGVTTVQAAEPKVDTELLEFLGSVDGGEESWTEFLARTDVKAVAIKPKAPKPKSVEEPEAKHD